MNNLTNNFIFNEFEIKMDIDENSISENKFLINNVKIEPPELTDIKEEYPMNLETQNIKIEAIKIEKVEEDVEQENYDIALESIEIKAEPEDKTVQNKIKDKEFRCYICLKIYKTLGYLERHQQSHIDEKIVSLKCSRKFSSLLSLQKHEKLHNESLKCNLCLRQFTYLSQLSEHERTHTGERPFKCTVCGKGFNLRSHLNRHVHVHSGEKPYQCDKCSKSFNFESSLRNHKMIHKDEQSFMCDICSKKFTFLYCLRRHVQRVHSDEKPFQCDMCSKSFSFAYNLKEHKKRHTDEWPYLCGICSKKFVTLYCLKRHVRNVHGREKSLKYDKHSKSFKTVNSLIKCKKINTDEQFHDTPNNIYVYTIRKVNDYFDVIPV